MTHLYVVSTTNLFHLEGPSRWNRVKRSRNMSRSCASKHEFWTISNIFNRSAYRGFFGDVSHSMTCRSLIEFLTPFFFFQSSIFQQSWHRLMKQLLIWLCKRCLIYAKQLKNMSLLRVFLEKHEKIKRSLFKLSSIKVNIVSFKWKKRLWLHKSIDWSIETYHLRIK